MTFTYKYLGDLPTVFIHLSKDGHGWMPNKNDTIEWGVPIHHPLLELIKDDAPVQDKPVFEANVVETEPATPDQNESPVAVDYLKEN